MADRYLPGVGAWASFLRARERDSLLCLGQFFTLQYLNLAE